ncbi:MAG: MBL fold metallo-hydrolase, partial [Methylophaga sp.]|nr:MBL fold metallo-hydrolase [Methylophaga sp.]
NHTLVFDAGPKFSDSFNTGTAIVKPFLQSQGIPHIDTLIISHGDNDHIGGAIPLINETKTLRVLSSVPALLPNAQACYSGQEWQWDGVLFSVLHPTVTDHGSENNLSCVLRISNSAGSVLLTGDIEKEAEALLVQRYSSKLKSTLLIAPHHGSKTSSSMAFINAVSPKLTLFPIGFRNRYHFPHNIVSKRYNQKEISLLNTAEQGAIQLKFSIHSISEPQQWRQSNHKIWTEEE